MRTSLRRIGAGAFAYVVSYVLIGLVTVPRFDQYLTHDPSNAVGVLDAYHSAGSPLWQAVGWFTLNAHAVPINVGSGDVNFVSDGAMWLGIIPGWLGLVPMVACLLVGVAVTATSRSSPVPVSVGAHMIPGHLFAMLVSTVAFAGAVGPVTASASLTVNVRDGRWLVFVVLSPLVFGSLGALLGRSPVLTATIERLRSGPSLR
ncbi:hypothetical protein M0R89_02755 [Halorussus limi]|uniref:DUF7978 domain-containing protein n=1 Tax=Halorussus limi TaxID=2938695 RepID=A0A8U0HV64_9EURY|nr:hypothetical protein [Halorussus limi]UPV74995.1 hypothetical protein M0R89_02755 [Halorussus limi]